MYILFKINQIIIIVKYIVSFSEYNKINKQINRYLLTYCTFVLLYIYLINY